MEQKNVIVTSICRMVVKVASVAPNCCRGNWYQPEEPKGMEEFLKKCRREEKAL